LILIFFPAVRCCTSSLLLFYLTLYLLSSLVLSVQSLYSCYTGMGNPDDDDESDFVSGPEDEEEEEEMSDPGPDDEGDEDDEEDPPFSDDEDPVSSAKGKAPAGGGKFPLPVRPAKRASSASPPLDGDDESGSLAGSLATGMNLNLDSLSAGLMVKQPPKLLGKVDHAPPPPPPTRTAKAAPPASTAAKGKSEGFLVNGTSAAGAPPPPPPPGGPSSSSAATVGAGAGDEASVAEDGSVTSAAAASTVAGSADGTAVSAAAPPAPELVLRDPVVVKAEALNDVRHCLCLFCFLCSDVESFGFYF
jgi:hypothetical protein